MIGTLKCRFDMLLTVLLRGTPKVREEKNNWKETSTTPYMPLSLKTPFQRFLDTGS